VRLERRAELALRQARLEASQASHDRDVAAAAEYTRVVARNSHHVQSARQALGGWCAVIGIAPPAQIHGKVSEEHDSWFSDYNGNSWPIHRPLTVWLKWRHERHDYCAAFLPDDTVFDVKIRVREVVNRLGEFYVKVMPANTLFEIGQALALERKTFGDRRVYVPVEKKMSWSERRTSDSSNLSSADWIAEDWPSAPPQSLAWISLDLS
jgi:hypothetical protein